MSSILKLIAIIVAIIVDLIGLWLIAQGAWLINRPTGLIVTGVILILFAREFSSLGDDGK